jgi:hypothetical protein
VTLYPPSVEDLLERVALRQQSTASILRASGRGREADRLELYAARLRLRLEQPDATQAMYEFARRTRDAPSFTALVEGALDGAMSLTGAERGNIQLRDPATGGLRIICHCGFDLEFLEYFAVVEDDGSACGRAASGMSQVVVTDVDEDPGFAPHREVAAASRFRAVQSTPLVDRLGNLIGIVSTHFGRPHRPSDEQLRLISWYADLVGNAVASGRQLSGVPADEPPHGASSRRDSHAGIVYRHGEAARVRAAQAVAAVRRGRTLIPAGID